jgi:hypothetical protein
VRKADNLPPSCADVKKSGSLNLLEPSGSVQACNGTALPFTFNFTLKLMNKFSASNVHFFTTIIKNVMQSYRKPDESNPRHTLPLNSIIPSRDGQVFQKSRNNLKIFGAKTET